MASATQASFPFLDLTSKIEYGIRLLQVHQPENQPYYGCFSGGKDSVVIKELARIAGVNVVWHYNQTTIDPPELVHFIRRQHPDVLWTKPKHGNFFHRMVTKGFPTRRSRWCCEEYKETASPRGAVLIFGVRRAESPKRAKTWKSVTFHSHTRAWAIAPILDWTDDDVWTFIRQSGLPYCFLYDEGFHRLGCIGCPMARKEGREEEFRRWPKFEALWKRAFQRVWEKRTGSFPDGRPWFGDVYFHDWKEMWDWWLSDQSLANQEREDESCQLALDMYSAADEPELNNGTSPAP